MEVFGREPTLFWPSEMAFSREMIPHLVRNGYRQVVIDHVHVKPIGPESVEEIAYQTHIAEYGGKSITVIPRDRDLSNAQESGLDPAGSKTRSGTRSCSRINPAWSRRGRTGRMAAGSDRPMKAPVSGGISSPPTWNG